MTGWLADAVFYEIYPQSFADSNGDGVGDLPGALDHLDHLAWLGMDAVWFNPCLGSPFRDAGYDVSDYLTIAPRYGSNDDMWHSCEPARERRIRVVLDLVAGHTSTEHEWFRASAAGTGDRLHLVRSAGERFVASPGPRPGYYLKNFDDSRPALTSATPGWTGRAVARAGRRAGPEGQPGGTEGDQLWLYDRYAGVIVAGLLPVR